MSLLVVGSMAYDAIETPFGKTGKVLGGAATYISLASSYFVPNSINVISVVGEDFDKNTLNSMNKRGIDTKGVKIIQGGKTFFWSGRYHNDLNTRDTLATELNVLADFQPEILPEYQNPEFLMLGNLTPAVQLSVIEQLEKRPKLIGLDTMNFWIESALPELEEVLRKVDVLIINDEEARMLAKDYSLVKSASKIMQMGPRYVIIKKGEHGALLFHKNHIFFAPALPIEEVFDPTGAGDTFAGGFIGYLAKVRDISFESMKNAVIFGSAMASFCVEKFSTERLESLKGNEINERVEEFIDLVQFDIDLV